MSLPSLKKTNAMRLLDAAGIPYDVRTYEFDENDLSGVHAADALGMPRETVFKTLVVRGDRTGFAVFCIPVAESLDLKKAAKVSGNKAVEMLAVKELLPNTGYIRGGCSPIGMKKRFPTYIHESCLQHDYIYISAGVRGLQIRIAPTDLITFVGAEVADISHKMEG